jgi:4-hydroxy-2-oxoheptanedioate aldolase
MKTRRSLHERLSTQRALVGILQTRPNPSMSEMAGMCGYDFLILDAEHGSFSESDYLHSLQALGGTDAIALVRLAKHDPQALGRYLDMGADGVVVPNVSTAEQAKTLSVGWSIRRPEHGGSRLIVPRAMAWTSRRA